MASDYYPHFVFSEIPECPKKWSSSNAWGENTIQGNRQLNWYLNSSLFKNQKQICWHIQEYLQNRFIRASGTVNFESVENGQKTLVTLSLTCSTHPDQVIDERLNAFKKLMDLYTEPSKLALKIAA
jgi:hypothetical protein